MSVEDADLAALRESVRKLLATSYPPEVRRRLIGDQLGHDEAIWRLMADQLGLPGLGIPPEFGGSGASAAVLQVVFEELGAALYSGPYFACVALAAPALLAAADAESQARYLPQIADGSLLTTLATTEPARDWSLDDIATVAVPDATAGWLLSGSKAYVVDAGVAHVVLVSANTPNGVGLFAVDPDATGCAVVARPPLDLTRRLSRIELAATPGQLLSGDRDVAAALSSARDHSFVALTAEQVGVATAALQMAVDYAGQREQFGHPIGQFQAIKHMCAEMLVDVESAAALASALARSADNGDDLALPAAMAKALGSDVAFAVAARTIQVHGGIGFTWEHDAHLYYRRAKSSELMFGDGAWQRRRVAGLLNL